MKRNSPLLRALRLEWDDVYQELAVVALNAINSFDPMRSECIQAHIWMKLQYAILDIKRRYRPCGMTAVEEPRPQFYSVELSEELGYPIPDSTHRMEDNDRESRLRHALDRLEPQEREVVILYLDGVRPSRRAQRDAFTSALEKLREFYLAARIILDENEPAQTWQG